MKNNYGKTANPETFPAILKNEMAKKGITQTLLAEALNVSQPIISDYLRGKKLPKIDILISMTKLSTFLMLN